MSKPFTVIPEGYVQITHLFAGNALPTGAAVTYGMTDVSDVAASVWASATHALFVDNVMPALNSDITLVTTQAKRGPNATGEFAEFTDPQPGQEVDTCATPNVTYLVKKQTALGGRRNRGRLYLPGVTEDRVNAAGDVDGTFLAALQGDLDDWFTALTSGTDNPVVLHRDDVDEDGEAIPDTAPAPTVVTSFVASARAATQRRRLRR